MNEKHLLQSFKGSTDSYAMLCPDSMPALVGTGNMDWHCPNCDAPIFTAMFTQQILNLLVKCYRCNTILTSQLRVGGQPFTGAIVLFPEGKFRLSNHIDIGVSQVTLVGYQAWDEYKIETGFQAIDHSLGPSELDANSLRTLAIEGENLLGEHYSTLEISDRLGQTSPTPPLKRHRLIELIKYVQEAATNFDTGDTMVDAHLLSELHTCISLFKRWHQHPAYSYLLKTLISEVQHSIILLAAASYLTDSGNSVGIVFQQSGGRIPDLWITPTFTEHLKLEIKTPQLLYGALQTSLKDEIAKGIIENQLKKAASGKHSQLDSNQSGLLVIGSFHLDKTSFDTLVKAATQVLALQTHRKKHLAGIAIINLTYLIIQNNSVSLLYPSLTTEFIKHPGYEGGLIIQSYAGPSILKPSIG